MGCLLLGATFASQLAWAGRGPSPSLGQFRDGLQTVPSEMEKPLWVENRTQETAYSETEKGGERGERAAGGQQAPKSNCQLGSAILVMDLQPGPMSLFLLLKPFSFPGLISFHPALPVHWCGCTSLTHSHCLLFASTVFLSGICCSSPAAPILLRLTLAAWPQKTLLCT